MHADVIRSCVKMRNKRAEVETELKIKFKKIIKNRVHTNLRTWFYFYEDFRELINF